MVMAYELFTAVSSKPHFVPRLANSRELESMYAMLQETLVKINFISHQNPEHWMFNVRRLFCPPRPPGPGGPGDQRHLPPDRLVRGQEAGRRKEK